jgi:hypothetical protein
MAAHWEVVMKIRLFARIARGSAGVGVAALAVPLFASTAWAETSGGCGATLNGVDVAGVRSGDRGDDIKVSKDSRVPVVMTSAAGFKSHKIELEFGSRRWPVSEKTDDGSTSFTDTVNVDDYATYGVGLYKVIGVATLTDGTMCSGAATVDVSGNPLATVAGAVAAGTVAVATVAAAATGLAAASSESRRFSDLEEIAKDSFAEDEVHREEEAEREKVRESLREKMRRWPRSPVWGCLSTIAMAMVMLPFMAISGGGGAAPAVGRGAPEPLPRVRLMPHVTLVGLVAGFLLGAGAVVLAQQYSIEYPTQAVIIRNVVVGVLLYGLVVPTIGKAIAVRRLNGRVAAIEARLRGSSR